VSRCEAIAGFFQICGTQKASDDITPVQGDLHELRVIETTRFDGLNLLVVVYESNEAASL
jgi:hypothetical protein